ncbi:hypothetical protein V6N13_054828 [Hibiscus sabdariffa]
MAGKLDKQGRRFGFVRYSNQKDALRAIERLNGFKLYVYKLIVKAAKYKTRTKYWRKKSNAKIPEPKQSTGKEEKGKEGNLLEERADKEEG